jgi:exonuclease III
MSTIKSNVSEYIGFALITIFAFGWIDTLWMFGVENSKEYTWWYLIHLLGN